MTPKLTPEMALEHLRALSIDIREGVILSATGVVLAGSHALAGPARNLLAAASDYKQVEVRTQRGYVFGARSIDHALAVVTRRSALPATIFYDLTTVLEQLGGPRPSTATRAVPR